MDFARTVAAKGAGEILLTSMDRDGTKAGYNIPLTRAVADAVDIPVNASGGVGALDDFVAGGAGWTRESRYWRPLSFTSARSRLPM